GSSGTYGFRRPAVRDRWHNGKTRGDFLNQKFCERYWVPFLRNGEIIEDNEGPEQQPWWLLALSTVKIKYLVLIMVGAFLLRWIGAYLPHWVPAPCPLFRPAHGSCRPAEMSCGATRRASGTASARRGARPRRSSRGSTPRSTPAWPMPGSRRGCS